ncbi:hypothetical protein SSX86_017555 [Deinandra increscens subsp. villosa]|uniref:Bet v I/Major latex protein domain-containing protein n=1 Tax=Deinandra increscens subsp. villosa TaxID=3103831 RepID=A0AAP0D2N8_9ASTR
MALIGTLVKQVTIKSDGDVFHEIFRQRPHQVSDMSPDNIQGVGLDDGEWGTVGSVIVLNFFHEGKAKVAKEVIDAIDEEKKLVSFKVIGGDIFDTFKSFLITVQVDTKGDENIVTWTMDYEKLNENVEDPNSLMDFVISISKDMEKHQLTSDMPLKGTLTKQVIIKSDGDVFHEIFRQRPHEVSDMSPDNIQGVGLDGGEWGTVGSIIVLNFFHDGKAKVAKEVIDAIDEEKKLVSFKVIGGDIFDTFKSFLITVQVDTKGDENIVTWTMDYEKLNENVEDPNSLMDFVINISKDMEKHQLTN